MPLASGEGNLAHITLLQRAALLQDVMPDWVGHTLIIQTLTIPTPACLFKVMVRRSYLLLLLVPLNKIDVGRATGHLQH